MAKNITKTVTVFRVIRINNSVNGTPAYTFRTDAGDFRTKTDTMESWAMGNTFPVDSIINGGNGVLAELTMTPAGRVWDWKTV